MRRLLLVLTAAASAVSPAAAAANVPPSVAAGSAHKVGVRAKGWFVVENTGARRSHRAKAQVLVNDGRRGKGIAEWKVPSLRPGERRRLAFSDRVPPKLAAGEWRITACMGGTCLRIGRFWIVGQPEEAGRSESTGVSKNGTGSGPQPTSPAQPISTIPTDPLPSIPSEPFEVRDPSAQYWAFVPDSYDASNQTPTTLFIWLHGCGGESSGDIWVVDPGADEEPQDWITIAPAEREGECWTPSADEAKVMAALADAETHFNVDRRRVILGGYSSGGDLAYRTGFRNSSTFAGLLIENSSPFRDTESTQAESLGAATTKFHIVHLAHLQDTTYGIAGVRSETEAVKADGFPLERIEVPGEHFNEGGDIVKGHAVPGTDADLRTYLLPRIDDGWLAPAP